MPSENPWVYNEARDRIRDKKEKEASIVESKKEDFEKSKSLLRKRKTHDVRELQRQIETGNSLDSLKSDIKNALSEWIISRDTYDRVIASIDKWGEPEAQDPGLIDPNLLPFSQNALAQYFENQTLWKNIWTDIGWFLYGLIVQWWAIMIIIAWKILTDFLFLPRDLYREFTK